MNEKSPNNQKDSSVYSLRQRYLFVSFIIVVLIFAFAWLAQSYVSRSSQQHARDIESRLQASHYLHSLRDEIQSIEFALGTFMWTPLEGNRAAVHQETDRAQHYFDQLRNQEWFTRHEVANELDDYAMDLKQLHGTLDGVMDRRLEKKLELPILDEIATSIRHAASHFREAANELLHGSHAIETLVSDVLRLWDELQVHHNAHLNGNPLQRLNDIREAEQQTDIVYQQLRKKLNTIAIHPLVKASAQRQQLLGQMRDELNLWHLGHESMKLSLDSIQWHSDVSYLIRSVDPQFEELWEGIHHFEDAVDELSRNDARELSEVANTIAKAVWLICSFGLAVITVAYLYFQGTVLKPLAMVAAALKRDADGEAASTMPVVHNLETRHLIDAYDEMRRQVMQRQQKLEYVALHDSLTNLPNRSHLMSSLNTLCNSSEQESAGFTLLLLGLDHFTQINETLGQNTGDTILKKYGRHLQYMLRKTDSVARFAGDEFAVLLPGAKREEALYMAQKLRSDMERPFDVDGIDLSVTCSIGVAVYPEHGNDGEELTRRANIAMAIAKQHKTGIALFEERYDTSSVERIGLAGKLRRAIHTDALHLCYQPQYSARSGKLSGLEVLCRWEDAERGPISPAEFIPVAEQTGLIHDVTEWVIGNAIRQAKAWLENGLDFGVMSINISAFNLHAPNFLGVLREQLQKWDFPPSKLMLEVTESAMMADPEHAISTLGELHGLGLKLSIDDYGTGYSSLAYVKRLPVDELKIDKSFVMDMTKNENDAVIVRSTIDLAHNLGLKVVAEGVDNQEKQDLLEILNCDYLQGFHLARPLLAEELEPQLPRQGGKESKVRNILDYR